MAGQSMDSYLSMAGAFIEQTGKTGSEFGNAYKMIASRVLQQGSLAEAVGTTTQEMADAEAVLKKYNIAITDGNGGLRSLDSILLDVSNKWNTMNDGERQYVGNKLAGVRQTSSFVAIMQSMNKQQLIYNKTQEETNSLSEAQQKYADSLEGKLGSLKATYESLIGKVMSSDFLKSAVVDLTNILNVIGTLDGKTIAFIGTIGLATIAISKLVTINKTLMAVQAGEGIATGFTQLLGVLTGMTPLLTTTTKGITEASTALEIMQVAQLGVVEETVGLTGVSGAWTLISTSIKGAVASSLAFMATPIGMAITAITIALGVAIAGFVSYKQHQEELIQKSKDLKTALDGVNESLKNGDTKGASENLNKIKNEYDEYKKLVDLKKEYQDKLANASDTKIVGQYGLTEAQQYKMTIQGLDKQLEEHKKVLDDAGVSEETFAQAEDKVANQKVVDKIKEETKSQMENRVNVKANTEEYNNYISTVGNLYSQYQNLSKQETLSTEQKTQLSSVVDQLQGKIGNLDITMDSNGKTYINNESLITDTISYLNTEGMTVETLTSIRLADQKANATWQFENTSIIYAQTNERIAEYQREIQAIQALMGAKIANATAELDAQSIESVTDKDGNVGRELTDQEMQHNYQMSFHNKDVVADRDKIKDYSDKINALKAGKDAIDKAYTSLSIPNAPSNEHSTSRVDAEPKEKKDKSASEAKKAEEELVKSEKKIIDDITDAYNKAKDITADAIEEIDANVTKLGDADDSNFTKRIQYATDKIAKQKEEVSEAQTQLDALKNTTVTTAEAQEALENATLKANKELRTQTLEAYKLEQELKKTEQEQLKKIYDKQKEVDTTTLEEKQKADTKALEDFTQAQSDAHDARLAQLEAESKALEDENDAIEKANDLEEKKLAVSQAQLDLERAKNSTTNYNYQKQADGSWGYKWTSDKTVVEDKQKTYDSAKKDLEDTQRSQQLDESKKAIEDQKTAENDLYKEQEKLLKAHEDSLKSEQDREKARLETYYSDIETMAKGTLDELSIQYNNNWNAIADSIELRLTKTQQYLKDLNTLKDNFSDEEVQKVINSGTDLNNYLVENKNNLNKSSNVDFSELTNELNNIKTSQTDIKNNTVETDDIISYTSDSKNSISKVVESDLNSLKEQTSNLQDTNKKIEDEYDSHYKKLLEKQNKSQTDQYISLKNFADVYTKFTDKFLELVQIVYDYRFTNIVSIAKSSGDLIMELLVQMSESYEKFVDMYNNMHKDDKDFAPMENIDVSDNIAQFDAYKQSVLDWTNGKSSLYDSNNNPLYSEKAKSNYVDTSQYANQSAYTLGNSNLLSSGISNNTTNNSNAKTINQYSISDVKVNAENVSEFIDSITTLLTQDATVSK